MREHVQDAGVYGGLWLATAATEIVKLPFIITLTVGALTATLTGVKIFREIIKARHDWNHKDDTDYWKKRREERDDDTGMIG